MRNPSSSQTEHASPGTNLTTRPLVAVKKLDHFGDLPLPTYETTQSAGMDLRAALAIGASIDL